MINECRKLVRGILVILILGIWITPGIAQDKYPSKPISLIVGYAAGGSTDAIARALIEPAKEILKVPIAVLNKPGAGTAIGMEAVKNAKPDGYTLGVIVTGSLGQARLGHANYDPFKDFTPICHISRWVMGFPVNISSPWKTFQEFQAYAKAHPGEIKYAASGSGSTGHLVAENLAYEAGIKIQFVPMASDAESAAALMGGHVQAACPSWGGFGEHSKAGRMRLLLIFTDERIKEFPDVPTPKELGLKVGTKGPLGIVGPRGLSPEVVKTLAETFREATQDPRFVKFMENMHTHIVYKGPEEFLVELRDYDEWAVEIMRRIGLIK
jgi:tripartite-type tricarboxylate transporter receptor subunit TctC